jgi:hypothetical protein
VNVTTARHFDVGTAGYNPAGEKTWHGRPFWRRDGEVLCSSHTIDVWDSPVVIRAFGLPCDSRIVVQMVAGCNEGSVYQDLYLCGRLISLTPTNNLVVLPVDGRYRLRLMGADPDEVYVVQHRTGIHFDFGSLLR